MADQYIVPLWRLELVRERDIPYQKVGGVTDAAHIFHEMLDSANVEKIAAIHCNSGGEMIGAEIVAIGQMEKVQIEMADLFRGAIRNNAAYIWMAHNHVDGVVRASVGDFLVTKQAMTAAKFLSIDLMDHLVIGPGSHYSIMEHRDEMDRKLLGILPARMWG